MTGYDRLITEHQINPLNDKLRLAVIDPLVQGAAHHHYRIIGPAPELAVDIHFQKGPIAEAGVNGLSHEVLLAIVIDRLRCFQSGRYACRENALALTKLEEALHWLHARTRARVERGVEGTSNV